MEQSVGSFFLDHAAHSTAPHPYIKSSTNLAPMPAEVEVGPRRRTVTAASIVLVLAGGERNADDATWVAACQPALVVVARLAESPRPAAVLRWLPLRRLAHPRQWLDGTVAPAAVRLLDEGMHDNCPGRGTPYSRTTGFRQLPTAAHWPIPFVELIIRCRLPAASSFAVPAAASALFL